MFNHSRRLIIHNQMHIRKKKDSVPQFIFHHISPFHQSLFLRRSLPSKSPIPDPNPKMIPKNHPVLISVVITLLSMVLSTSAASDQTYTYFLQCLQNHTDSATASSISTILVPESSTNYAPVLDAYLRNLRFTTSTTPKPVLVITPTSPTQVSAAVVCAAAHGTQLRIRSGGHDYEGLSYTSQSPSPAPFLILDLFQFNTIRVDAASKTAYVGAGATLGELYFSIWNQSNVLGFPAGVCPTVGVGGHVSGGGYGNMLRRYGLSVDHVTDAEIVTADGRILDRKSMGEDLFWAIRGGGGASFGVILSFTVNLVDVPETVTVFNVQRPQSNHTTDLVYKWQFVMQEIDPNLFIRLLLQPITDKTATAGKSVRVTFIALFLGDKKTLISTLNTEFPELGITDSDCTESSWIESLLSWANYPTGTPVQTLLSRNYTANYLKRKSDYVTSPIPKSGLEKLWAKMVELKKPGLVFNSYGGVMDKIAADATPFPHRAGSLYKIQYSANWNEGGADWEKQHIGEIRALYSFMEAYVSKNPRATFLNYRDIDIGTNLNGTYAEGKVYGEKYFVGNFGRLVSVKTKVDPNNFFSYEQSIPVLGS